MMMIVMKIMMMIIMMTIMMMIILSLLAKTEDIRGQAEYLPDPRAIL